MIRLILSSAFGLSVALVPLYLVVGGVHSRDIRFEQRSTRFSFKTLDGALARFHARHGRYPSTLRELDDRALDAWQRRFLYSLRDGKPLVESLGRDGKRGGIGTDADLSNRNPKPAPTRVPFWTRVSEPDALQMSVVSSFCGLLAGIVFWSGLQNQTFVRQTWPAFGTAFLVAASGAVLITSVHIPSGH